MLSNCSNDIDRYCIQLVNPEILVTAINKEQVGFLTHEETTRPAKLKDPALANIGPVTVTSKCQVAEDRS